jgi:hypothetical protein
VVVPTIPISTPISVVHPHDDVAIVVAVPIRVSPVLAVTGSQESCRGDRVVVRQQAKDSYRCRSGGDVLPLALLALTVVSVGGHRAHRGHQGGHRESKSSECESEFFHFFLLGRFLVVFSFPSGFGSVDPFNTAREKPCPALRMFKQSGCVFFNLNLSQTSDR